ncbi:putative nuclease HARBI1 [Prorops nasuta]|uniref:putative nuclease HARBI1 n=1 Tax=Prorops nasuta TaxID=863751 RepID=UPI0034CE2CC0
MEIINVENDNSARNRMILRRCNYFELLNDRQFQSRFRLTKLQFEEILQKIEPILRQRQRKDEIAPVIQLLVAIRFYATGCFLQVAADFCGISSKSAQLIVHRISPAIADLFNQYISLPKTDEELMRTTKDNFLIAGMIRVIGAIDCVHVRIRSYGGEDAELWRNRKGFFSLNVQCVVNSHLEIMDLVVRWPGSTHDSTIFANSRLKHRFDHFECGNGILLGDRGYANHRYLITPLANPTTPAEILYNEAHIRTRNMVERCFGIWGRTFAVLTIGSRFTTPERTINVILATAVLYNIIRRDKKTARAGMQNYLQIPEVFSPPTEDERQFLINNCFEREKSTYSTPEQQIAPNGGGFSG